jgi:hypothetical protein
MIVEQNMPLAKEVSKPQPMFAFFSILVYCVSAKRKNEVKEHHIIEP